LEAHTGRTSEPGLAGARGKLTAGLSRRARQDSNVEAATGVDEIGLCFDLHLEESDAVVLHHRLAPGAAGEISHLILGSAGITVIDASNYDSPRARIGRGGLRVGRRNRSKLIQRVVAQVESVRSVLAATPFADVHIDAALAWRKVEGLPVLHSFSGPRVIVCGPRKIAREALRPGSLSKARIRALAAYLERELPLA
jgi:hypothetical protein